MKKFLHLPVLLFYYMLWFPLTFIVCGIALFVVVKFSGATLDPYRATGRFVLNTPAWFEAMNRFLLRADEIMGVKWN